MEQTCRLFRDASCSEPLSFSEIAARWHCRTHGISKRLPQCSWKQTLLPAIYMPKWDCVMKHPSVELRNEGHSACVAQSYKRGTFMTVFDSTAVDLSVPNLVYTFRVRINTDTSRAGITVGIVDPLSLDPRSNGGCELCETKRGWGVFVCKGIRDKFTNGLYHGGKYVCGRDSPHIKNGWSKDDMIEIVLQKGEILFRRNDADIEDVRISDEEISGQFVFAVTLYNSRLQVEAVSRDRRLSQFESPKLRGVHVPPETKMPTLSL